MKRKNDNELLIRSIGYFSALTRNLSYTQTAAQLGISQPALTQQIKKLEDTIGTKLFYNEGKKIHLSESGKIFLSAIQKVNNIFSDANDEMKLVGQKSCETINVGMLTAMPANVLIDFIVNFKKENPKVDYNVTSVMRHGIRSILESDSVDCLFLYLPDSFLTGLNNYKIYRFCKSELYIVSTFKIKDSDNISLKEAVQYPWSGYPEGYYVERLISDQCRKYNLPQPKYSAHFTQVENILNFSKKAGTIAAIPETCLPFVKKNSYVYRLNPSLKFDLAMVYRPSKLKIPIFNKSLNEFQVYLEEKDYMTRMNELVKETNE